MRSRLMTSWKVFVSATVQYGSEPGNLWSIVGTASDMGTPQNIFFRINYSQKVLIRLNSWLTMVLQELIQISSRLKMDFWKLIQIDSRPKSFKDIFIQINSWLKKIQDFDSNQLMTQKTWNIDLNRVMTQWFESTIDLVDLFLGFHSISLTFFGLSLNFVYLFGVFNKFRWPFWDIQLSALIRISSCFKQYHKDLSQFNSWLKRLSRN